MLYLCLVQLARQASFANYWILALFDNVKLAKMSFYSLEISKTKNTSVTVFTIWRDTYVEDVIGYI